MGTVTSLRRVVGYAGVIFGSLGLLAWALVTAKVIVLSTGGLLVAAVVSVAGAAAGGADAAFRLKEAARLCKQGRITDATIVSLDERLVSIPSGFNGWVTKVKVSFTDASGHLINAGYTDYARAAGKREGQAVQIAYDPAGRFRSPRWAATSGSLRRFSWPWGPPSWREWRCTSQCVHSADPALAGQRPSGIRQAAECAIRGGQRW